jgi:phage gp46-like protein
MTTDPTASRKSGKYLVSPLIKALGNGWFASSVSIRSGSGSATTDRVLRLTRLFRCATEAAAFAHSEALQWIHASRPATA